MPIPRVYVFGNCVVIRTWPETRFLETRFSDGSALPAAPEDTAEYAARAKALGYGVGIEATWSLCREHEIAHTFLSIRRGLPYSSCLWKAAHDIEPGPDERREEETVLAFQRLLNDPSAYDPALDCLLIHDLPRLRDDALWLLRREGGRPER